MTYNQLWKRLTAIYNEREAQAIVRTVLKQIAPNLSAPKSAESRALGSSR